MTDTPDIVRDAVLSDELVPLYRYRLSRIWDMTAHALPIIMLNPSTADHELDDPTIKTCMRFARRDGFGGINVANLLARRSPHPSTILAYKRMGDDVNGPENDQAIRDMFENARHNGLPIWAAWGNGGLNHPERLRFIAGLARETQVEIVHAGLSNVEMPKHPLARGQHRIPNDFAFQTLRIPA